MSVADQIYSGLIARGMAPHIAQGFVMNMQDESGLDPSIIEAVPNVHGTRGRGLYQLTGPRRTAYESRYGEDYSIDNQLDWLMYELNGPEARAAERIYATSSPGEAGAAIVTHFLRPAAEHRDRRVRDYLGGGGYDPERPPSVFNSPQNALAGPSQPQGGMTPQENALAMMQALRPPQMQANYLDPADFMSQPFPMGAF